MKAEFKRTKTADGLPLTFGKMYDVLDIKTGKRPWVIKEIKVENDLGRQDWYSANKFNLLAEGAAFLEAPTAVDAGQSAVQSTIPDGARMIRAADAAAGYTAREALKIGEAAAAGLANGLGLYYGA